MDRKLEKLIKALELMPDEEIPKGKGVSVVSVKELGADKPQVIDLDDDHMKGDEHDEEHDEEEDSDIPLMSAKEVLKKKLKGAGLDEEDC